MFRTISLLALFAILCTAATAHAEYRIVLIQLKREKDKTLVTIHSDVKEEQKRDLSVAEAGPIVGKLKGWGSSVGVYVTHDGRIPGGDAKQILNPLLDNFLVDLISYGGEVPANIKQHFLK